MKNVTDAEMPVLETLVDHYGWEANCLYFRTIAKLSKTDTKKVRRIVRSLARKGYAEYVRGLFDEDGQVAGSGYCATKEGMMYLRNANLRRTHTA